MNRRRRNRRLRSENSERIAVASQDTPEQVWRKWDAMHETKSRLPTTLQAIQQSTWVYSAVTFIAEHIMRTPLCVRRAGKAIESHPILSFLDRPNVYGDQNTSAKFRYAYMVELLLHGAAMRILGQFDGFRPKTMSVRPRWQFRVYDGLDEEGRLVPNKYVLVRPGVTKEFYPQDTIFHDALYNPLHDYEGLAPLTAALLSVSNDNSINEFAERFFANDGSTGIVFSTDSTIFNQRQADDAAKKWKEAYSGLRNAFGVKFVSFGLRPFNVGNPLDAKMLQILRSFTKEEIVSGIFKVPLDAISAKNDGGDIVIGGPSGGTQASAREAMLINVVMPWAMRYDEEFNSDVTWRFDPSVQVLHDFTSNPILERRRLERAMGAVQLIDRGVPLNEVIRWLHLEIDPQPHGDDWWVQNDRLPARVVMAAGQDAFKIAVPDPVAPQRKQAQVEYIASILSQADQRAFQETVRIDADVRSRVFNKTNGQCVQELLSGSQGRPPLGLPVDGRS